MLAACLAETGWCLQSPPQVFVTPVPHFWNIEIDNTSWVLPLIFSNTAPFRRNRLLHVAVYSKFDVSKAPFFRIQVFLIRCVDRLLTADISKEGTALFPERWRRYGPSKRQEKIRITSEYSRRPEWSRDLYIRHNILKNRAFEVVIE